MVFYVKVRRSASTSTAPAATPSHSATLHKGALPAPALGVDTGCKSWSAQLSDRDVIPTDTGLSYHHFPKLKEQIRCLLKCGPYSINSLSSVTALTSTSLLRLIWGQVYQAVSSLTGKEWALSVGVMQWSRLVCVCSLNSLLSHPKGQQLHHVSLWWRSSTHLLHEFGLKF